MQKEWKYEEVMKQNAKLDYFMFTEHVYYELFVFVTVNARWLW